MIWTVPTLPSYPLHGDDSHGADVGAYGAHGGGHGEHEYSGGGGKYKDPKEKEKEDKKKLMMGAAAGVAVGVVGGAIIANALGMSSFPLSSCLLSLVYRYLFTFTIPLQISAHSRQGPSLIERSAPQMTMIFMVVKLVMVPQAVVILLLLLLKSTPQVEVLSVVVIRKIWKKREKSMRSS